MSDIWTPPGGSADAPRPEEPEQQEPSAPEGLTPEQLVEQIRRLRVSDVVLSSMSTVAQLGYAKLEPASRDLDQARLAIESLRALIPVLEGSSSVPPEVVRDFGQVVANLQLAYASAVDEAAAPAREDEPAEGDEGAPEPGL
jgi:hypothetical protein